MTLHPKAAWGDGTPITSKDVAFTIEVGKHPKSGVASSELYRRILKVERAGRRRKVTFELGR